MKVFTDKSFEKSQEGKYFKLVTDRISIKEYVNVRFEMTAIPRSTLDLRFQELAQFVRGEISAKLDRKVSQKPQDILVATQSILDKFYELKPNEKEKIKLRMPLNTRYHPGDEIEIQPQTEFKVEIKEKSSFLTFEKSSQRLVTSINITNISEKILKLENGEEFGQSKRIRSMQNKMASSFWRENF